MKKFDEYSPEELRAISRRGGIASGTSRRNKKIRKQWIEVLIKEAMNNAKENDTSCTLNQTKKELAGGKRKRHSNK